MKQRREPKIHPSAWHHHPAVRSGAQLTSGERARHDYETNTEADMIVKEIRALTGEIHAHTCGARTTHAGTIDV